MNVIDCNNNNNNNNALKEYQIYKKRVQIQAQIPGRSMGVVSIYCQNSCVGHPVADINVLTC